MAFSAQRALMGSGSGASKIGYWIAGDSLSFGGAVDGINFVSETLHTVATTTGAPNSVPASMSSRIKGYLAGGFTPNFGNWSNEIQSWLFATEVHAFLAATLTIGRREAAGVMAVDEEKGYIAGGEGDFTGSYPALIEGFDFNTELHIVLSVNLPDAGRQILGACSSTTHGYWAGGSLYPATFTNRIDGITFATEATINPGATLATSRIALTGWQSQLNGYWAGGFNGGNSNQIDGIRFSTDSAINPAAALSVARGRAGGLSSRSTGYAGGGSVTGVGQTVVDGMIFETETSTNPSMTLSHVRTGSGNVQQWPQN